MSEAQSLASANRSEKSEREPEPTAVEYDGEEYEVVPELSNTKQLTFNDPRARRFRQALASQTNKVGRLRKELAARDDELAAIADQVAQRDEQIRELDAWNQELQRLVTDLVRKLRSAEHPTDPEPTKAGDSTASA